MGKKEVLETFKTLGDKASYHYADDSCKEKNFYGALKKKGQHFNLPYACRHE